jgi:thioredoxin-related protein
MKKIFYSVLGLFLTAQVSALEMGDSLPTINQKLKNSVTGKTFKVSDIKGKAGTLLIFTANECPYAQAWQDRISSIGNDAMTKGFAVVAINSSDSAKHEGESISVMRVIAKRSKMNFPYAVDETSDVARILGASKTPEVFLFDAKKKLVFNGAIDDNAKDASAVKKTYLKDALSEVLAGKEVSVHQAQAMGCGIKFREKKS